MILDRNVLVLMAAVLSALWANAPASAGDQSSLRELLGRAQSQSETKAVEELIDKLQGNARKSPAPIVAPAPAFVLPAGPPDISVVRTAPSDAAPAASPSLLPPSAAPSAKALPGTKPIQTASPIAPDSALEKAEQQELPSVDIEVLFEYNSTKLTPQAVAAISTLGRALSDIRLAKDDFLIAGHTDAKGGADFNLKLSQMRAEAVRQFLLTNFNIDQKKLVARGFGMRRLKTPENPLAAANRRVQIVNLSRQNPR